MPFNNIFIKKLSVTLAAFVMAAIFPSHFVSSGLQNPDPNLVLYQGPVYHIFFHSLIVYPQEAKADTARATLFANNMITAEQFKTILQKLYDNNFILFDSRLLYAIDASGKIRKTPIYVPQGKKPLILSQDDLNYYTILSHDGFASKLVVHDGKVETEIVTPEGQTIDTDDGDVVPIVDAFVAAHPDFSLNGARGILAVTGYDGILGYRTQPSAANSNTERTAVLPVIAALKQSGWIFASHSYGHGRAFKPGANSTPDVVSDIAQWKKEVEPLVGETNIFIGPFGQIFKEGDPRRTALVSSGFSVLYGVGIDNYVRYFDTYVAMDRINIDGYRLTHNADYLQTHLGI